VADDLASRCKKLTCFLQLLSISSSVLAFLITGAVLSRHGLLELLEPKYFAFD